MMSGLTSRGNSGLGTGLGVGAVSLRVLSKGRRVRTERGRRGQPGHTDVSGAGKGPERDLKRKYNH